MRTPRPHVPRPPVRLIPYSRTAPVAATAAAADGQAQPAIRPDPFRHPPGPPWPRQALPRQVLPRQVPPRSPLRAVPADGETPEDDLAVAAPGMARLFAEVIVGIRPLHQLAGRTTPEVYDRLAGTLSMPRPAGRHASWTLRVTVPLVQVPLPGVAEVSAVVFTGGPAHALALRLERLRGRWRCAAVETTISPRLLRDHLAHRRQGTAA